MSNFNQMQETSNLSQNPPLQQTAVVRSTSEIQLRINNLKLDQYDALHRIGQYDAKKWFEDASAKYESDRKYLGRESDPTEYIEVNRQLVELNVQIMQLEWVLGLRN